MNQQEPIDYEALMVRWLAGEASAEESLVLDHWRALSTENEKQFADRQRIWEESRALAAQSTVDVNEAWKRFQQRIQPAPVEKKSSGNFWRVAAVFILVVGTAIAGWLGFRSWQTPATVRIASADSSVTAPLPDGSVVTLNTASSISYPANFKGQKRSLRLTGEAFFAVARDTSKPFTIEAGRLTITVIGTSFNVKQGPGVTEVIVATGKVKVQRDGLSTVLLPGDKLTAYDSLQQFVPEKETDQLYQYYRKKQFVCDNTPLWKLVAVLEKAYGRRISINNPAIRDLRINTSFNDEPLDKILSIVAQTLDLKVIKIDENYVLE
ncbi:MAG TPA: FecR domain-containing protein [Flavihumibacter sp.]|mgnify:CR=1 FL=1|nr:FecR domain-containing protein [Bacteroidota bacterium]HQD08846.1 FecR domain-containing protein [Flavihumibacter sp.]